MERQQCKLCTRSFSNIKALAGHMKSHMFPLPLPLPPKHQLSNDSTHSSPSFKPPKDFIYGLRDNPKKSYKLVDPHFHQLGSALLLQDSDTESTSPTQTRLTRVVQEEDSGIEEVKLKKKLSSTESVTELEDVAACLMMLSRDKWRVESVSRTRKREYTCETCKKEFGTFQALGGHATSHKKVKKRLEDHDESMEEKPRKNTQINNVVVKKKLHECPVCFRVFGSGQALGGHKRSHFLGSSSTSVSTSTSSTSPKQLLHEDDGYIFQQEKKYDNMSFSFIDLNSPAPADL
ncbi:hypothetical protein AgCh_019866 [Apium graveolens]